jgi:hypothetical protein
VYKDLTSKFLNRNPQEIGNDVLEIWNARVESLRNKFSHLRNVVLIKSFTWQSHGSQFTIIDDVPQEYLLAQVKPPKKLDKVINRY